MSAASAAAAAAAAAAASISYKNSNSHRGSNQAPDHRRIPFYTPSSPQQPVLNRYETRKRNDWNAFRQHLKKSHPSLILSRCTGVVVIEFLDDQFGNTKTHSRNCPFFENPDTPGSCSCPLMQAWSSLDGLVGRLRVAFEENGGRSENNPFSAGVVRVYLSQVKDAQAKAAR